MEKDKTNNLFTNPVILNSNLCTHLSHSMLCVTKLSSIQHKDVKSLSFVLLFPWKHWRILLMIAPASDLPLLKVKKLSKGCYYHLWLWSLYFRLSLETGLEIPEEKWAHWGNYQLQKAKYPYQSPRNKTVSDKLISYRTLSFHDVASWKSYRCVTALTLVHVGWACSCRGEQSRAEHCSDMSIVAPTCFPRGTSMSLLIQHHSSPLQWTLKKPWFYSTTNCASKCCVCEVNDSPLCSAVWTHGLHMLIIISVHITQTSSYICYYHIDHFQKILRYKLKPLYSLFI